MTQSQSLEVLVTRWEDQRDIKNLMGRYALETLLEQRDQLYVKFWSQKREDVCLGFNNGWYVGSASIQAYYAAKAAQTGAESALMKQLLPKQFENVPEEKVYGAGHLDDRPVSSAVVEVADDGMTAKAMFTSMGFCTEYSPKNGPVSNWIWGIYAADFVFEDDAWRIWHLQYLEELHCPCGQDWANPQPDKLFTYEEFAPLSEITTPAPDVETTVYEGWSPNRVAPTLPPLPVPYATFADTFSYGIGGM